MTRDILKLILQGSIWAALVLVMTVCLGYDPSWRLSALLIWATFVSDLLSRWMPTRWDRP